METNTNPIYYQNTMLYTSLGDKVPITYCELCGAYIIKEEIHTKFHNLKPFVEIVDTDKVEKYFSLLKGLSYSEAISVATILNVSGDLTNDDFSALAKRLLNLMRIG